jgi:hypothetical protein
MATKANARGHKGAKKRGYKRRVMDLKNRTRDLDRIQDDIKAMAEGKPAPHVREGADAAELPGGGASYCAPCARHFIDDRALALHAKTKDHRKQLRRVAEEQYTQAEADAGAGASR